MSKRLRAGMSARMKVAMPPPWSVNHVNILLENGSKFIGNYLVIGDLNYDILSPDKSQVLDDLCDISDLTNIVKNPTCVMKGANNQVISYKFRTIL
jgi:hypothetical protein